MGYIHKSFILPVMEYPRVAFGRCLCGGGGWWEGRGGGGGV